MSTCESAEDILLKANIEFLDRNYKSALELYNFSVELDDTIFDAFFKRALCFEQLRRLNDAVADTNKTIALDPMNFKAYYLKGVLSFEMGDTQAALECFEKCKALDSKDSYLPAWIKKCKSTPTTSKPSSSSSVKSTPSSTSAPKPTPPSSTASSSASPSTSASPSPSSSSSSSQQPARPPQAARPPAPIAPKAPRAPKVSASPAPKPTRAPSPDPVVQEESAPAAAPPPAQRYTWYQTDSLVVVTVFVKSAKPSEVSIDFELNSLSINIALTADNQFLLDLDLAHDIDPVASKYEVMSTKVEIKMKKAQPIKWNTIERKEEVVAPPQKKQSKNWDKILANEEEDKDTGFNQLMKDMYSGASEEERRAMMKSFHESGGTVLSCDWKDVGKGYVEPKPPVGVTKWEKDAV